MKIACFTSNHPRHIALLDALVLAGHEVTAVIEPKPYVRKGTTAEDIYWGKVDDAERYVFGYITQVRVPAWVLPMGELSKVTYLPADIHDADRWVVFGSSYIKGWVLQEAIQHNALNLHAGIAPEYRGSAPNFWAEYDNRPEFVGAQVQALSPALDGGSILAEYRPPQLEPAYTPWLRGMLAVQGGIIDMLRLVRTDPKDWRAVRVNDPRLLVRYAKYSDFTPEVVAEYLGRFS